MQVAGDNDIILHNTLTGFQSADLPTLLPSHHLTTAQHFTVRMTVIRQPPAGVELFPVCLSFKPFRSG